MRTNDSNSTIAVVMCVHGAVPPAVWRSALTSLTNQKDVTVRLFVFLDGPVGRAHRAHLHECESAFLSVTMIESPVSVGLAAGLNALIDAALSLDDVGFVARMDADDISLSHRFRRQLAFLASHPDVGIVGSACLEFDEFVDQDVLKVLPERHEELLRFMTTRSPFVHPTVMFRRSTLETGQRYDPSLRLMQDYDLWVRLAYAGVRFANISEPLLRFRTSDAAFVRRRGIRRARREVLMRWNYAVRTRQLTAVVAGKLIGFGVLRCMPVWLARLAYRFLR
jgi:hypothetical protein